MPEILARPVPTPEDVDEISTIANLVSGGENVFSVTYTRGGVLIRHSSVHGPDPDKALRAIGYTITRINGGTVLVTGSIDQVALLEAQIRALTSERDRLIETRRAAEIEVARGGPF